MRPLLQIAALIALSLILTGCGKDWIVGKWEFDEERTLEAMTPPKDPQQGQGLLSEVVSGLQRGFFRTRDGAGEAIGYKVIEKPNADRRMIQYDDGDIVTIERVEGGIRTLMSGDDKIWVYFRAVE